MTFSLHHGDCLEVMAGMEAGSVDAVVTDPPYGLGFMDKAWDGLPPGPETAAAMLRLLKPSSYLLAFGGTRTWHRLACALEDAGFEIRDTLMWLYGSGFPKGKACLKPAWEPIILARKPGPMRELGIEECRVATNDTGSRAGGRRPSTHEGYQRPGATMYQDKTEWNLPPSGRWPANLILDEEVGAILDGESGPAGSNSLVSGPPAVGGFLAGVGNNAHHDTRSSGGASRFFYCPKASRAEREAGLTRGDVVVRSVALGQRDHGTLPYTNEPREMRPVPRANHHPTVKPLALMRWLIRLVAREGDTVVDPFMGSGTTGVACVEEGREFIGIDKEAEYVEIARARIEHAAAQTRLPL